jgi:hypothetical protein
MAETRAQADLTPQIWDDQFSTEFFQGNPFSRYMGTGANNPIRMKEDFASKQGNGITFEFITNLDRGSIRGRQPLRGHEDKLGEYGDKVFWDMRKKGVSMHELDEDLAAIDLRKAAKGALRTWADEDLKYEIINALQMVGAGLDIAYEDATTAQKNTWHTNNRDRVLYGLPANYVTNDHAASLANIDNVNDKLTKSSVSLIKRMALRARPRITPLRVEGLDKRFFVGFAHPFAFRDLTESLNETERTVSLQSKNTLIFEGGDREYDGVIIHEVDDMPTYNGVGAAGINVAPFFLMGQEAVGWANKARYSSREQKDDYDQVTGLGMIGKWGGKKLGYTIGEDKQIATLDGTTTNVLGKQRGMVSGFFAASGD